MYIVVFSIDDKELVPPQANLVRAGLPIGGWKLEPLGGNKIKVTYFVEMDFRGYVPTFLLTVAFKD